MSSMFLCVVKMKKVINKYRNGTINNPQYSLNYKFDSISSAGKINGTALELIKKYNELAKEAHSNGNYTEMENFRQYAEHYRKIVTDINEKKNSFKPAAKNVSEEMNKEGAEITEEQNNQELSEEPVSQDEKETKKTTKVATKKTLKVVEIKEDTPQKTKSETKEIKRKVIRKKAPETEEK